jgi:hypothetical protein
MSFARLLLLLIASAIAQAATPTLFGQVDEMLAALSNITGWQVHRRVPADVLSKDKFRRTVESQMKEASSDKETRSEELALKMFGLVPDDFNLARESADLVTEQAAAFYDYRKKRLFVLDTTVSNAEQRMALVHELAHALADQQYPLGKYIRQGSPDDDASTARQAVMEGQATWLTWAYLSLRNGGKPEVPRNMLEQLSSQAGADGDDFPVFNKAPLYIRESLVFPYNEGMRFQDAVYRDRGHAAFDVVFRHPPESTQQIMHPAAYLAGKTPTNPQPPSLGQAAGKQAGSFRALIEGSLGEFDVSALLRQYLDEQESRELAAHWRGGAFRLYEHKHQKYPVLTYTAEWDSPEAARSYFALYQKVLRGKWKKLEVTSASANEASGQGDTGRFQLRLEGSLVQSIEGLR